MYKLTILLLTILEARITYMAFYLESLKFSNFLILHGLVALVLFFPNQYNKRDIFMSNRLTVAIPFVGIFLYLIDLVFFRGNDFKVVEEGFDFEKYLDKEKFLKEVELREELKLIGANTKGIDEKKEFITKLKPRDIKIRVRMLKKGLVDKDIEVVHYSAVVFNQLSENFEKQLKKYKKLYNKSKLRKDFQNLIGFYGKYLEVGILEGEILKVYREDYIKLLEERILIDDELEDHIKILGMYITLKNYSEAEKRGEKLLEKYINNSRIYEIMAKVYYESDNLEGLKKIYYECLKRDIDNSEVLENIFKICGIER
ncbi:MULTISPECIES: tetratricopeptide repeat protein [Psychrilyobacter]|uniref:Uncharacterized protein n=1 Tax=Psychrilyobacter piezotolerans TaxID=2293438 RepID=A0ABX9KKN0_9FUSO|nr:MULTISPECIES: hypothetical protein [Psychrilyobacter]MCS5421841.1 hypothetical protein [Psychrilyobacter sp. S5]NDI76732.1 hypothetical protein [Psychrilyobacter piezotolerans]RDE65352.1 hypothetical protein DV867_02150 [Psychrilyobacter sp. S5]REI42970.1 hypothetical protein DYH56_02150 [Psychrilyobacter piezotolerans]